MLGSQSYERRYCLPVSKHFDEGVWDSVENTF